MSLPRLSLPPRIKVMEALGALADGRVERTEGNLFRVVSSDGSRTYSVYVEEVGAGRFKVCSTDNGTVYRGYAGYPILAAMMLLGYLRRDPDVERALAGIPWRRLNEELKRYHLVEAEVLRTVSSRGVSPERVKAVVERTMAELRGFALLYEPSMCGAVSEGGEDTD